MRRKRNGMRVPSREELLEGRERKRKELERLMTSADTYERRGGKVKQRWCAAE